MFFGQDHFFEELFCICIQLVNKTWKEMRATQEDFDKVTGKCWGLERGLGTTDGACTYFRGSGGASPDRG